MSKAAPLAPSSSTYDALDDSSEIAVAVATASKVRPNLWAATRKTGNTR